MRYPYLAVCGQTCVCVYNTMVYTVTSNSTKNKNSGNKNRQKDKLAFLNEGTTLI